MPPARRLRATWTARREDLTPEWAALLEILDRPYGKPAQLTFLDT
jgi:hypothetical protein